MWILLWAGCNDYSFNPERPPEIPPITDTGTAPVTTDSTTTDTDVSTTATTSPTDTATSECSCPEGFEVDAGGGQCTQTVEVEAILLGEPADVCRAATNPAYGLYGAHFPGGTIDLTSPLATRLNSVGVWTCDPLIGIEAPPVAEWIGFSVCVDAPAQGEYLLGHGADNRMRITVDGQPLIENVDDAVENFRYWWLRTIRLGAGPHVIEFEGYNAGGPAALGAEIYGPFAPGSLSDDASILGLDPLSARVWSSTDALGATFALGETSGWTCPDGYALNLCDNEPSCSAVETAPCE